MNFKNNYVLTQRQEQALEIASKKARDPYSHYEGCSMALTGLCISKMHMKTLVICPLSVIESTWADDAEKFGFDGFLNMWKMRKSNNLQRYIEDCKICAINFDVVANKLMLLLGIGFDCLIIDGSSKLKNPKSKTTLAIKDLSYSIPHVYIFQTPIESKEVPFFKPCEGFFRVVNDEM